MKINAAGGVSYGTWSRLDGSGGMSEIRSRAWFLICSWLTPDVCINEKINERRY